MDFKFILDAGAWVSEKFHESKKRILVVEDDPSDAFLMKECMEYLKKECAIATTAEAAEALIKRNNISIAFVDMRLTHMQGWELIPMIWHKSPHTVVVATCGNVRDLAQIKEPELPYLVMEKPVTVEKLEHIFKTVK